jgi:hypothetical protein
MLREPLPSLLWFSLQLGNRRHLLTTNPRSYAHSLVVMVAVVVVVAAAAAAAAALLGYGSRRIQRGPCHATIRRPRRLI